MIDILQPVLDAGIEMPNRDTAVEVYERLGVSAWFIDAFDTARGSFSALLKVDPTYDLDDLDNPPELVRFFRDHREQLRRLGFIGQLPATTTGGPTSAIGPRGVEKTLTLRKTPTIAYMMPFGVGQMANEQPQKGALLAALQGVGLALHFGGWLGVELQKDGSTGLVSADRAGTAELLQGVYWVGTTMFLGTWAYSIVDGYVNRLPVRTEQRRLRTFDAGEIEELEEEQESNTRTPKLSLDVGPGPTPLGLGVTGRF